MTEVLLYINQSIELQSKPMDWFLYDRDLCHERLKVSLNSMNSTKITHRNLSNTWLTFIRFEIIELLQLHYTKTT